jgi:hypothetical protein
MRGLLAISVILRTSQAHLTGSGSGGLRVAVYFTWHYGFQVCDAAKNVIAGLLLCAEGFPDLRNLIVRHTSDPLS